MIRKVMFMGVAAAMGLATLVVPTQAASAADGCGEGWFKQSDGYLTKDVAWQGVGAHNAHIYHSGRVRFCTDDDTFDNDENRRALIGYPSDTYAFQSEVSKNGTYGKFCVKQTVKAHMTGIKSSDSWNIGGSVSKGDASVSASYSATYDTLTVTVARTAVCGASVARLFADTSGYFLTADNETGKIDYVTLTTQLIGEYTVSGAKHAVNTALTENDYS